MTYRVGNHHGVTICAENDGVRCGREGHDCARGHLVAVVVKGDQALAERICALLNGDGPTAKARPDEDACSHQHPDRPYACERRARHDVHLSWQAGNGADAWLDEGSAAGYARGFAEALAEVRRRLDTFTGPHVRMSTAYRMLRDAAAELGVDGDVPPSPLSATLPAEQPQVGGSGCHDGAETLSAGMERYRVYVAPYRSGGKIVLGITHDGCPDRWFDEAEDFSRLSELNRRAGEHTEGCR